MCLCNERKMKEKKQKVKKWPNNPNSVKPSSIQMSTFKKYYPSTDDMNEDQLRFFKYWKKEWQARRPRYADLSYIFTYAYEVIHRGIQYKRRIKEIILEINALISCYPGIVADYLKDWKLDLLIYHEYYEEALKRIIEEQKRGNRRLRLNCLLNLKIKLGHPMDGRDLLNFAESLGLSLYKATKEHLDEAISYCQKILFDFQQEEGEEILYYISNRFAYEKRHDEYLFAGINFPKTEIVENDLLTMEFKYSESKTLKEKCFNFYKISFFVEFVLRNVDIVNKEIKYKYQKNKRKRAPSHLLPKYFYSIWEAKIYDSFKNPSPDLYNKKCPHIYLKLVNHWEPYRKYECINCNKTFMCSCERELAETVHPYKKQGTWLNGICPKCRGLNDTSPITPGKLMYGSNFYAQYWREIWFERDIMAIEIAKKEKKKPHEAFQALLSSHEPENRVRKRYGVLLVGEGWISETTLFKILKKIFPKYKVIHHGTPKWLENMHLDVYIPELKIAFEYQGRQHSEPIEYFGGKDGFEQLRKRDKKKFELCKENDLRLFYIHERQDFSEEVLRDMLKEYID